MIRAKSVNLLALSIAEQRARTVTLDPDAMHIDPDRSREHSLFGRTVAVGFLTISLLTRFYHAVLICDRHGHALTGGYWLPYGFDRLRLTSPVRVDSRGASGR